LKSTKKIGFFWNKKCYCTPTLFQLAREALVSNDPNHKVKLSHQIHTLWKEKTLALDRDENVAVPEHPGRPERPILLNPKDLPSHKKAGVSHIVYLLHGLAHIELNAIDMCWDLILRFSHGPHILPESFYGDFISVAADESRHFHLLSLRLQQLGSHYGALPAHNSLWKHAEKTKDDLKARVAVMQLVQEARALDSHERLVHKVRSYGDKESGKLVDMICTEELDHVAKGVTWFKYLCSLEGLNPVETFHSIVKGSVEYRFSPPFNNEARQKAGMEPEFYSHYT